MYLLVSVTAGQAGCPLTDRPVRHETFTVASALDVNSGFELNGLQLQVVSFHVSVDMII